MVLEVKNLGPIKEAKIDLNRSMTIFCGPNNTGKTYLSYIIYAMAKLNNLPTLPLPSNCLTDIINKGDATYHISIDKIVEYQKHISDNVTNNLDRVFGLSKEKAQTYFKTTEINFIESKESLEYEIKNADLQLLINRPNGQVIFTKTPGSLSVNLKLENGENLGPTGVIWLGSGILPVLYKSLALYPVSSAIVFPVERNSIYTFSKEVAMNRMQTLDRNTRYPLAIEDNLLISEDLANIKRQGSDFSDLAAEIEEYLLTGKMEVSKDGEMEFVSSHAKTRKLPIHLSASIVKTLSSLVFYLKHRAKKGDLIIIDEPELNLHPDQQVKLVRIFGKMINRGFRFLISTHSDYIIKELNNLIMLSDNEHVVKKVGSELGYKENESINPQDVTAYYFSYKTKTAKFVTVQEEAVDKFGFAVPSIDKVIAQINKNSEELFYAVKYPDDNAE